MSSFAQRRKTLLTIAALILAGVGVLLVLERLSPGVAPPGLAGDSAPGADTGSAVDAAARSVAESDDPVARPTPEAPAGIAAASSILLAPPGTAAADLVLREDGGWEQPASRPAESRSAESQPAESQPAESQPAESRPAHLVLVLPRSLPALGPKARASLAAFLESRRPRPVVTLPAAATAAEREELARLLEWVR